MHKQPQLISSKIEKDGTEFQAWCPELLGCHTHGKTLALALENLKDAISVYLNVLIDEEIALQTTNMLDEA